MKKTRIILITLILLMTLSSCETVNIAITTPSPSMTEAATDAAVVPSPTDVPSETPIQTETVVTPVPTGTPIITPIPTENPGPRDIELDFLNDKFDKVEALVDGIYVDISD
ncbi:MAG: hypothetical protein PHV04_10530, partial [Clostridia bacterium]|nr:hypothetical protein [Clostridia bacterium]